MNISAYVVVVFLASMVAATWLEHLCGRGRGISLASGCHRILGNPFDLIKFLRMNCSRGVHLIRLDKKEWLPRGDRI